jgi:hypothetical protein
VLTLAPGLADGVAEGAATGDLEATSAAALAG